LQKNWNFVQQEGLQKAHVPTTEEHMSTKPNCVIVGGSISQKLQEKRLTLKITLPQKFLLYLDQINS
jgi:hypothetical protein